MKRFFLMACCLVGSLTMTFAQEQNVEQDWHWANRPSSMSFTVGAPSLVTWIDALGYQRPVYYGSYSFRYDYNILRWLAVGGRFSYDGMKFTDSSWDSVTETLNTYQGYNHYGSAQLEILFTYINKEHVQLYSGVSMGLMYYWRKAGPSDSDKSHNLGFAGTVIPIGVHLGSEKVYALAEVSVGTESMMSIGLGFHF